MTINIMSKYIEMTKEQINSYMKVIFGETLNQEYCDLLIEKYINVRYYNFYEDDISGTLRKKIMKHLSETEDNLIINNINDRKLIENMALCFYYILYFDGVIAYKDLHQKIDKIERLCNKLSIEKIDNFNQRLFEVVNGWILNKDIFLESFSTNDFYLKKSRYTNSSNVYRINIKYNIRFPEQYSDLIIRKTFNTGITNEDKLVIEYYLIVIQIIKDLINNKLDKQYILEFADTLLSKSKKIENLLNIISNSVIQDKVCLKIRYEQFLEHKEIIFDLMRNGFGIAVIMDGAFKIETASIEKLKVFRHIIINPNLAYYKEFMRRSNNVLKNLLEI